MKDFLKRHKKLLLSLLLIFQMALIFTMSSFGSDSSSAQSNQIIRALHQVFPNLSSDNSFSNDNNLVFIVRKTAHFTEYAILGLLFFLVYRTHLTKPSNRKLFFLAIFSSFLYACTDELHQLFVSGRSGQFTDVLIDTLGAFFGCLLLLAIKRLRKAWRARRHLQ